MKKELTLCLGALAATAGLSAFALELVKENRPVPEKASAGTTALVNQTLGQTRNVPMRAPEGGYTAPCNFLPTTEEFAECTIVDVNEDATKWSRDSSFGGCFKYGYNTQNAANDWCFLPAVNLTPGNYKVTYSFCTKSYAENFAIYLGQETSVEAMTTEVMKKEGYKNTEMVTESTVVAIPSAGEWVLGLYAFSAKNMFGIYIQNVGIQRIDDNQPTPPQIISITSDGYEGTLVFNLPSANFAGEALEGTVSASVYLGADETPVATVSGQPGQEMTVPFEVEASGEVTVKVIASVEVNGETLYSEPDSQSHRFTKHQPSPIPVGYRFIPDEDEFSWCTVINSNEDTSEWKFSNSGHPDAGKVSDFAFRYNYSYSRPGDDWIILPAIDGTLGGAYQVDFNAGTKSNKESLQVCMAYEPTVEAMQENVILNADNFGGNNKFERMDATFTVEEGRNFYIGFHATSAANRAYIYLQDIVVEKANGYTPAMPFFSNPEFDGGDGTINFTFPTLNSGGNQIGQPMTANVMLDGEAYGEAFTGTAGQTAILDFSGLSLGQHVLTATVTLTDPEGNVLVSKENSFNLAITVGSSFFLPVPTDLALNSNVFDAFKVFNVNNDDKTWVASATDFSYSYSTDNAADDWIISPAIEITDPTKLYDITVYAKVRSSSYAEQFAVYIGKEQTVEAMTETVVETKSIKNQSAEPFTGTVFLPEAGRYYVGIHCTSPKNFFTFYVTRLVIAESESSTLAPSQVTNLEAAGFETGELKANVSFNFPTTNILGQPLDADEELTATITSLTASAEATGLPGAAASVVVDAPTGDSNITVTVANSEGAGLPIKAMVNCGLDRPQAPQLSKITVGPDNMSAVLEWEPVTRGVNGGNVNAAAMDYYIFEYDPEDEDWYQLDVTSGTSYEYELANADEPQSNIVIGVQAYNGVNSGSSMSAASVVLGKPLTLPVTETFEGGRIQNQPLVLSSSLGSEYAPEWSVKKPETVMEGVTAPTGGYALYGHTGFNRGDSFIALPKFSTEETTSPGIEFVTYDHPQSCEVTVYGAAHGQETMTELGKVTVPQTTNGWVTHQVVLPESLQNQKWVNLKLHFNFTGGSSCIPLLDSYVVRENVESGIVSPRSAVRNVAGLKGAVAVNGFEGCKVDIFTTAGQKVAGTDKAAASANYRLPAGLYLVKAGNDTFKVVVK